jgi:ATP-dependent DNA helicase DinG
MDDYIGEVFGSDGILSKCLTGYESRPGQIRMVRTVDSAFSNECHVMAEAPTGIGKSIAYSVPAIYHALENSKKTVIVTANIALQEQLFIKDLPFLSAVLPWPFKYSLIKGKSNYLCVDQWQTEIEKSRLKTRRDIEKYRSILQWAKRTKDGDKSELAFDPPSYMWSLFSVTSDQCKGGDCRHHGECFVEKARKNVENSDIFVTNYHLLFAYLKLRSQTGKDLILPPFDFVICDEAHKAADIARDFFGFRMTERSTMFVTKMLGRLALNDLYDELEDAAIDFFRRLKMYYNSKSYSVRIKSPNVMDYMALKDALIAAGNRLSTAVSETDERSFKAELKMAATAAYNMSSNLEEAITLNDDNMVYFIEEMINREVALRGKPITVDSFLGRELFDRSESVIMTSATLAVDNNFYHINKEVGVESPYSLVVESPFNFKEQALLVIPEHMPPANDISFSNEVAKAVATAIELADGRVLGLFTSYRNLNMAYDYIFRELSEKYNILRQGDRPRMSLVEEFKKDVKSVLLGTESFWAGVDVPGESLSCVVIDRLPFQTPSDPILDAVSSRNSRWFMSYSIPRAIIALKQGFGRLIRNSSDRGVVVVLDRRIVTKPYGVKFLASLPEVMRSKRIESIGVFLGTSEQ